MGKRKTYLLSVNYMPEPIVGSFKYFIIFNSHKVPERHALSSSDKSGLRRTKAKLLAQSLASSYGHLTILQLEPQRRAQNFPTILPLIQLAKVGQVKRGKKKNNKNYTRGKVELFLRISYNRATF